MSRETGMSEDELPEQMRVRRATYDRLMHTPLKLEKKFPLDPKAVQLCAIALDENTGNAGSIHIPVGQYQQKH